jgi:hypothetical protein
MMTKPTIKIHNVETGEVIEREMTADELAQQTKDDADAKIRAAAQAEADTAKAAAQSKLAALGLTTDDLKALGL